MSDGVKYPRKTIEKRFQSPQEMSDTLKAGVGIDLMGSDTWASMDKDGTVTTTLIPFDCPPEYEEYESVEAFVAFVGDNYGQWYITEYAEPQPDLEQEAEKYKKGMAELEEMKAQRLLSNKGSKP